MNFMNRFPKIKLSNDENVALMFMEAITKYSTEDAKKYISRNVIGTIDFTELKDLLIKKGGKNANNIFRSNKNSNRI